MGIMRKMTAAGVVAAMLATTATPAFAGGYGSISIGSGYGYSGYGHGYGRHRRHRDRVDTGDVIGAIAVVGIIAAIASASSKKKSTSTRDRDWDRDSDWKRDSQQSRSSDIRTEDAAVDACAVAAEQQAGQTASVRDITSVTSRDNGWSVEGVIEERDNWRDRSADRRRFTCTVRYGEVEDVRIESGVVAFRD